MSYEQSSFYNYLIEKIEQKEYLSVEGSISYLFVYAYGFLNLWDKEGYEYIYNKLLELAEAYYYENRFSSYVRCWAYDCLLGLEKYEEYLLLTEPEDIFSVSTHSSNERCNIYYHIGKPVNPIDIVKMSYNLRVTNYTKKNSAAFRDFIVSVFSEDAEKNGAWLERLLGKNTQTYHHSLFNGAPINQPCPKFPCYCFYSSSLLSEKVPELVRNAENQLREAHNVPKIGEGWVSETALYYAIKNAFPQTQVIQHGTPDWVGNQHLDIWIPAWKIAIEYHGTQHFEPVEFFGGIEGFEATKKRDARKKRLCKKNGVELIVVTEDFTHKQVIEIVNDIKNKKA
ncbi:hypothetical protein QUF80_13015 [Desulfococcaceae bacterium HSG8]|nr:hypothetical protein [Desulfococcaceae bacterium HSG8]